MNRPGMLEGNLLCHRNMRAAGQGLPSCEEDVKNES